VAPRPGMVEQNMYIAVPNYSKVAYSIIGMCINVFKKNDNYIHDYMHMYVHVFCTKSCIYIHTYNIYIYDMYVCIYQKYVYIYIYINNIYIYILTYHTYI
jgi:hypothetical protein